MPNCLPEDEEPNGLRRLRRRGAPAATGQAVNSGCRLSYCRRESPAWPDRQVMPAVAMSAFRRMVRLVAADGGEPGLGPVELALDHELDVVLERGVRAEDGLTDDRKQGPVLASGRDRHPIASPGR
jgi:hypothetical protein